MLSNAGNVPLTLVFLILCFACVSTLGATMVCLLWNHGGGEITLFS